MSDTQPPKPETDLEAAMKQVQLFVKAWAEAITEQFKPFGEAAARMQEQERTRRSGVGEQ